MTDNGSGYRSSLFNDWLEAAGIERKHARPYSPWQNGKVERMNRTLAQERQYARAYASEGGGGLPPSPPSSTATIGPGPTAPAAASRRCHASSV